MIFFVPRSLKYMVLYISSICQSYIGQVPAIPIIQSLNLDSRGVLEFSSLSQTTRPCCPVLVTRKSETVGAIFNHSLDVAPYPAKCNIIRKFPTWYRGTIENLSIVAICLRIAATNWVTGWIDNASNDRAWHGPGYGHLPPSGTIVTVIIIVFVIKTTYSSFRGWWGVEVATASKCDHLDHHLQMQR